MKRYFMVEIDEDERAKIATVGIRNLLAARYHCTAVVEMTELNFESRDGSTIHSDREMLDFNQQTVSAYIDK